MKLRIKSKTFKKKFNMQYKDLKPELEILKEMEKALEVKCKDKKKRDKDHLRS